METIPLNILTKLRQRKGLKQSDSSNDAELLAMTPINRLREVCEWELGDRSWADQVLSWAKDCGIDVEYKE